MKKIVTLGEIMLRLTTPNYQKITQAKCFQSDFGGGEANVAISLAQLGMTCSFVTKLPSNPLGNSVTQFLRQHGVLTEHIQYGGDRLGIYFLEKGFSIRPSNIVYDRAHSSFSTSSLEDYDWDEIFKDADWFHISGITPALNNEMFTLSKIALQKAKQKNITTSCDLNYRSTFWEFQTAREKMSELMPFVDVCIGVEPLQLLDETGMDIKDQMPENRTIDDYKKIISLLHATYGTKYFAMTFRDHLSVNRNRLQVLLSDRTNFYDTEHVEVEIVDRVGTGDAFSAGIIYGLINEFPPKEAIDFALGCFALKHTIEGDVNILNKADIESFITQKHSFSIKR